jgi:hypothetical protein
MQAMATLIFSATSPVTSASTVSFIASVPAQTTAIAQDYSAFNLAMAQMLSTSQILAVQPG